MLRVHTPCLRAVQAFKEHFFFLSLAPITTSVQLLPFLFTPSPQVGSFCFLFHWLIDMLLRTISYLKECTSYSYIHYNSKHRHIYFNAIQLQHYKTSLAMLLLQTGALGIYCKQWTCIFHQAKKENLVFNCSFCPGLPGSSCFTLASFLSFHLRFK